MAIQAHNHRNCTLLLARNLLKSGGGKKEVRLRPVLCDHARGLAEKKYELLSRSSLGNDC
jgi:hypothetical protein